MAPPSSYWEKLPPLLAIQTLRSSHMSYLLRTCLLLGISCAFFSTALGQSYSRSGAPATQEAKPVLKRLPCAGEAFFTENFDQSAALPTGFQVLDQDGQTPRRNIQFLTPRGGWQVITDLKDSSNGNQSIVSPAWYEADSIPSDDWLILPQQSNLPANTCFSFLAYSQDSAYPEQYEVRVSTTGPDPADFLANAPLLTVDAQPTDFSHQTVDLGAFVGEDVYLAIRHTSLNRFILVIDDLRLSTVSRRDIALLSVDTTGFASFQLPGDTVVVRGTLANRGLDTLAFDSGELVVRYRLSNGESHGDRLDSAFTLLPNETFDFEHYRPFTTFGLGRFVLEVFVEPLAGEAATRNNFLRVPYTVGTVLDLDATGPGQWQVGPNPTRGALTVKWPAPLRRIGFLELLNLQGQGVGKAQVLPKGTQQQSLDLSHLPSGLYLLHYSDVAGHSVFTRVQVE